MLQATIYNFDVELADNDRGVYESLALRLARHPSESDEHMIARQAVTDGLATEKELREIAEGWRRWAAHPDGWYAVLHGEILCRV